MARYDYKCIECGLTNEQTHSINETPDVKCPQCGSKMGKLISGDRGLLFKGIGFYRTDKNSSSL